MKKNFNIKKPLIIKTSRSIIISFNGKKLIQPLEKYKGMTEEEIVDDFLSVRGGET